MCRCEFDTSFTYATLAWENWANKQGIPTSAYKKDFRIHRHTRCSMLARIIINNERIEYMNDVDADDDDDNNDNVNGNNNIPDLWKINTAANEFWKSSNDRRPNSCLNKQNMCLFVYCSSPAANECVAMWMYVDYDVWRFDSLRSLFICWHFSSTAFLKK